MYRRHIAAFVLSSALGTACLQAVPPSGDPYAENTEKGGCKDGEDNDDDGSADCDDRDCAYAPACRWDSGGGRDTDHGHDTDEDQDVAFYVDWSPSGVIVDIVYGSHEYELGMADTNPESADPWTGEDCFLGYTDADGQTWSLCHEMGPYGTALATVDTLDDLVESETTMLRDEQEDFITYYAISTATGECWTWGADPAYFSGLGCVEM